MWKKGQPGKVRRGEVELMLLYPLCAVVWPESAYSSAAFKVTGATDASASSTFLTVTTGGNTVSTPAKVDFTGEAYASTRVGWSGRTTWGERTVSASWVSASGYCIVLSPFGNLVHSVDRSDDDHGLEYFPSFDCDG